MRRSSPEEQAAWRIESQQYDERTNEEIEEENDRLEELQPVWDGLAEMDLGGLSDAELDVLARHGNTPAIKAAALTENERRRSFAFDDLPF